jgi:hypothetical protein
MRILAILLLALFGCSREPDFRGQTYVEMVQKFGSPEITRGEPRSHGNCHWMFVKEPGGVAHTGKETKTEKFCGFLFANFQDDKVYDWYMEVDGKRSGTLKSAPGFTDKS